MVFSIVVAGLWLVSCVAGQYDFIPPWTGKLLPYAAAPALPIPTETKTQYHYEDGLGSGKYGHSEPTSSHHATHDIYGNKAGEFSYLKADGTIHKTRYIADSLGYRVESNDLPVGPIDPHHSHSLKKRSVGYPYVSPSGYLTDTPEVAAAKASHFQEHAKRGNFHIAGVPPTPTPYSSWSTPYSAPYSAPYSVPYSSWSTDIGRSAPYSSWPTDIGRSAHYQAAHPIVTPDGFLKDTPEVAQAKAAHFAEKAKVTGHQQGYPYEWNNYYTASPFVGHAPVTPEGQVTDTPEVIAAKTSHFAEYEAALARNVGHVAPVSHHYALAPYSGAPAVPAETPEVLQAKAAHFAEYAKVAHRLKRSLTYSNFPASTAPLMEPSALSAPYPVLPTHPISSYEHLPFFPQTSDPHFETMHY